jgi:hypothetical protein
VFARYYGAAKRGPGEQLYLVSVASRYFKSREPFPIVCGRVALVAADGTALGGAETPVPPPLPVGLLTRLGRRFAEAVLDGNKAVGNRLLTPAARRRLGLAGLDKLLPYYWDRTVRDAGGRKKAAAMLRKHLTVEAQPGGEAADDSLFAHAAPDVSPNSVRGIATVYPYDPESDCDPLFTLYFVGEGDDVRIGHAEPN